MSAHANVAETGLYGLMAEFDDPHTLAKAAGAVYERGFRKVDAYTPYPVEEVFDALHLHKNKLPLIVLCGGLTGACAGFALQYYVAVINYPLNIGGRPLLSWPAFIPVTFETTILFSAFAAVIGLIALCGFPRPYHPVFNNPRFAMASRNRFFLCIEAKDPLFDREQTAEFLRGLEPKEVAEVEK